ncbi:protein tyrosine phosphatase domain-containing protein 1 [Aplochiton taeniatus]
MESVRSPQAKYTVVGEALRYIIPADLQCSLGCGGQTCKYDSPTFWSEDKQAIKGLYSSWVTDNLLAMSRPSTEIIENYNIIDQFKRSGIKTVINLQRPGEHASCGNPLEPESGFSYRPEIFMENGLYFYNFGWNDYGVASMTTILDMVKVMAFSMQEGKMAVHCHAGLGRTGVLLACFLVFTTRMSADQAIVYIRAKRPNSIQTRGQLMCVREFVKFLIPVRSVFFHAEPRTSAVNLTQALARQGHVLHGYERRELRHMPKIIQVVCRLLPDIAENRQVIEEDILEAPDITDLEMALSTWEKLGQELGFGNTGPGVQPRLPGPPTIPRHFHEPPIFYHRKSLSYSDSDLRRLGSDLNLLAHPLPTLSQGNLATTPSKSTLPGAVSCLVNGQTAACSGSQGSLWEQKNITGIMEGSPLLRKFKQKAMKRSDSVIEPANIPKKGSLLSRWKAEQRAEIATNGNPEKKGYEEEEKSEVPFITIQTELSLDTRRLLVAQALAVDLLQDGEEEHKHSVAIWQSELNLGGAWECLCTEQDPFILTGLMWAWLEQLKEPAISVQAVQALDPANTDPRTVLNTLEEAPKQSLMCILDCMAHMLAIPDEIEEAFLDRTIKAFTQLGRKSEEGNIVYKTMSDILRLVLQDLRRTAIEEDEAATRAAIFGSP